MVKGNTRSSNELQCDTPYYPGSIFFFFSSLFNIFFIDFFLVCLSYSFLILLIINKIKEIFFHVSLCQKL